MLRCLALGLATLGCSGCATTPAVPRAGLPPPPTQAESAAGAVAGQLQVVGRHGRLSAAQRAALLARLGAQGSAPLLNRQLAAAAAVDDLPLHAHNAAQLLIDGPATFAAMFQAIGAARHTVLLQSYIIDDSAVAQRLAALLQRKRSEGVQVAVLYDGVGSLGTDRAFFDGLQKAGVATCAFNPVNPLQRISTQGGSGVQAEAAAPAWPTAPGEGRPNDAPWGSRGYWDITHRNHRKILSVDRQVGFTGGINISAVYSSGSFSRSPRAANTPANPTPNIQDTTAANTPAHSTGWRDTQLQLRGPAVAALDDLVRQTWLQQGCPGALAAVPFLPAAGAPRAGTPDERPGASPGTGTSPRAAEGHHLVRIVPSSPGDAQNRIYTLLLTAIDTAQRSVHLTMAYFAPGQEMVDALCDAALRGVDVQLVLPSMSDFSPVLHAGRSHYTRLLAAGVQVHELRDAVLHAKTAVIDGVVSTVGSSNMDWRSFASNDEVNAVVYGEDFGDAMTRMFRQDVAASSTVSATAWAQRPWWQRAREHLAQLFEQWW